MLSIYKMSYKIFPAKNLTIIGVGLSAWVLASLSLLVTHNMELARTADRMVDMQTIR